ncbi:MAG: NADH-quinone oxidoreductase subunit L [Candidatus Eiseniibacteriota bacterium]|jgi:NADH-quinone oxidoreductase subunit L
MHSLLLIPLIPLAGFLVNGLVGRRLGERAAGLVGVAGALGAFLAGLAAVRSLLALPPESRVLVDRVYEWFAVGGLTVDVTLRLDPLSAVMVLVVAGVGFLIHVYSLGYMHGDGSTWRYFAYLNLFLVAMLFLVLGQNLLLVFLGWEGVGLCSYLLIGFWYTEKGPPPAGMKAFLVNRVGDFAFLLGLLLLVRTFGTLDVAEILERVPRELAPMSGTATAIALLLFAGACGKSAQLPLHVWLPDAMEGPTPVSALIHAATMVTAGVYLVVRMHVVYLWAAPAALLTVMGIGLITALMAATIGLAQNDIKRVLAYSTISQLGYMFLACGAGAFTAAIFHLMTHAFFKALLFLGSGSVIHAMGGEQDMRRMGGLRRQLPVTHLTFLVGSLAIAGIFPLAGFFSKDAILLGAYLERGPVIWALGVVGAFLTAFYMFRLMALTFWGKSRVAPDVHPHESPPSMRIVLQILAVLSVVGGWVGITFIHGGDRFKAFLEPVFAEASHFEVLEHAHHHAALGLELTLGGIALVVAVAAIGLAILAYQRRPELATRWRQVAGPVYTLLANKYYVDELYDLAIVRPLVGLARLAFRAIDAVIIEGIVNGVGRLLAAIGQALRPLQSGFVRRYALVFAVGVVIILGFKLW